MPTVEQTASPNLSWEQRLWREGMAAVAGVDEVGRGCLAGPVVASAVIVDPRRTMIAGVNDSKKIAKKRREQLAGQIAVGVKAFAIGFATVAEIDRLNIRNAAHLAMKRALTQLGQVDHTLIDGSDPGDSELGAYTAIQKGDQHCYSIACASIVAKVARDRIMVRLANEFPGYAWESNAGYGTKVHIDALKTLGVTPHHRRSFSPVRAAIEASQN